MSLLEGYIPPTRQNWEHLLLAWQLFYPLLGSAQWAISWYGMGKTSVSSALNLPGRIGWMTMEAPGFLTLLYIMFTLPAKAGILDLPWQNQVLAGLFVIHYLYRAILFPIIAPSMSPIHVLVWLLGLSFQLCNATALGSWLAAYGPTTSAAWAESPFSTLRFVVGMAIFYLGLVSNFYHDDHLREIRRAEALRRARDDKNPAGADKIYVLPTAGLFRYLLFAHYFCEWIEWLGFWIAAGWTCVPARAFFINEVVTMLPRAVRGKRWYVERFGEDKIGKRWAVIPGVL